MRYAPRLSFHLDESLKKQAEILQIIKDTVEEDGASKPAPGNEGKTAP